MKISDIRASLQRLAERLDNQGALLAEGVDRNSFPSPAAV